MAYWVWEPAFSVGIAVIDNQHKRIIDYINELNNALVYRDSEKAKEVLSYLVDYTLSHFSFEESLMQEAGYAML
ncbi:MAG: bacteriohemerythrin, partial [Epsilonproteobacteria bacterium]|nr:bacteriohemerythrin [Campylobacterota bacterium]